MQQSLILNITSFYLHKEVCVCVQAYMYTHDYLKFIDKSPGWCGSVDWAPAYGPKGHQYGSQLGHVAGLWARPLDEVCERLLMYLSHIDVSLPFFLPPLLSLWNK